jgi:hypothetical protein
MASTSLRAGLFLFVIGSASAATVACGRVGLDADGLDGDSGLDSDLDSGVDDISFDSGTRPDTAFLDSGIFVDTGPFLDTGAFDTAVTFDTGRIDTGGFLDTGRIDTGGFFDTRPDTIIGFDTRPDSIIGFDTPPPDTGFDTGVLFDTAFEDTGITFDSDIDTGIVFDSAFDTGFDGGPVEGGIVCGPTTCNAATEICCAGFGTFSCTSPGLCVGTPLSCSSAASCKTGNVCCFNGGFGGTASATCAPFCPGIQLCAVDAECRPPQTCRPVFGGYRICR